MKLPSRLSLLLFAAICPVITQAAPPSAVLLAPEKFPPLQPTSPLPTTTASADPYPYVSPPQVPATQPEASPKTGCDCWFTRCCCCCCDPPGKVVGGVGLYLIQPFFANNPAISFFVQGTGPGRREDIAHGMGAAPLFWLGYMLDDGLGVRARWWFFSQATDQRWAFAPPVGQTVTVLSATPLGASIILNNPQAFAVTSTLQLNVVDLEAFQDLNLRRWNFLFAGGLGFADILQSYNAFAVNAGGAAVRPLFSASRLSGLGPVLALEARRPILDIGVNLYGSTRTRVLFGTSSQTASGGEQLRGTEQLRQGSILAIQELELGLEYERMISRYRFFGQVAMVGQEWFGAGNASGSVRSGPPTTIANFSTEDHSNFGFFGASFRLGVNY